MSDLHNQVIGLAGLPGSGKTTIAEYLRAKKRFTCIVLSDFIKEEAKKRNAAYSVREDLQDLGNDMRKTYGSEILVLLAYKKIQASGSGSSVIDGIRNVHEIAFLRRTFSHFLLFGVTAESRIRYKRLTEQGKQSGPYEMFLKKEERENRLGSEDNGLRIEECMKQADYVFTNNGTRDQLLGEIDTVLSSYGLGNVT